MMIETRSPTRVDLAGGTLDCWPLYNLVGGCETTNLAIDILTRVELEVREDQQIELQIDDLKYHKSFADLNQVLMCTDSELSLVRAHLRYWQPRRGFRLRTRSESPVGGGLGGSSSLCISLIKAFAQLLDKHLSTLEMVTLAHNLEAEVLRKPTGTQDYFPAVEPGLNVIHYEASGPRLERLKFPVEEFTSHMFLVYTGQPHHSGLNNWQVIKAAIDGHAQTLEALAEIKRVAGQTAEACRRENWQALPDLFQQESKARVQLSAGFSSDRIENLRDVVLRAGGQAVKICGAGGGGCVMVWATPEMKGLVAEKCQKSGYQVLNVRPVAG